MLIIVTVLCVVSAALAQNQCREYTNSKECAAAKCTSSTTSTGAFVCINCVDVQCTNEPPTCRQGIPVVDVVCSRCFRLALSSKFRFVTHRSTTCACRTIVASRKLLRILCKLIICNSHISQHTAANNNYNRNFSRCFI
jgi:hypothetical protein